MAVPVHRPSPRGRRGSPRRLIGRRCHVAARPAPTAGLRRSSATATTTVPRHPTPAQTANSPAIPRMPAMAPPANEPMIVAKPGAGREEALRRPAHPGRRSRREDRHAAHEHGRKPEPFERGDRNEDGQGSSPSDGQDRAKDERHGAHDEQPFGAESRGKAREGVHERHLDRCSDGPRDPDERGVATESDHLHRVERVDRRKGRPDHGEPGEEQRDARVAKDRSCAAEDVHRPGVAAAADRGGDDHGEKQGRDEDQEEIAWRRARRGRDRRGAWRRRTPANRTRGPGRIGRGAPAPASRASAHRAPA